MSFRKNWILAYLHSYRSTKPEHFWAAAMVTGISLLGMVAASAVAPSTAELQLRQQTVVEALRLAVLESSTPEAVFNREERVQRGDTVASLLARLGVQDEQATAFLRSSRETEVLFRQLRPSKSITARTSENGELLALSFPLNAKDSALVVEKRDGAFHASEQVLQLETRVLMGSGEIRSSLFAATDVIGLPDATAMQLAEIFGGDIDFHRDLRRGDHFSVVYEMIVHQGQPQRAGRILAAEFSNQNKTYKAFYFQDGEGRGDYYAANGETLRRAFLRSPLEFSRVSSGFTTARFHPILQTWRAHKGVDYAAPTGTRIKATGDGVVDFAGKQGGYGNLVVLRHQGKYTTHYGHLNGFAPSIRKGARVSQGDVIGFVGRTGWATGPHLHYEFRINDVHQNPLTIALPTALPLTAQQRIEFKSRTEPLQQRLAQIQGINLALLN